MMTQPDLFAVTAGLGRAPVPAAPAPAPAPVDLRAILERLARMCERPRYSFMVLNLIAQAGAGTGSAGPYVREGGRHVPVRDWLCDALLPVARRDPRRLAIEGRVRRELALARTLPADPEEAERQVEDEVRRRVRQSGRTNVSRAVSELVRAGLVRRHYQGYRVDHENRGAQRQAVYTITDEARAALQAGTG
jgi:hypothetical protein